MEEGAGPEVPNIPLEGGQSTEANSSVQPECC